MLNRNTRYSEWLLPYLEGGLDEARRAQLEARLAVDPALAAEARQLAQAAHGLRGVAARAPRPENAQVPADLWPHLRARLVLDPAPRPRARAWWLAGVGAPAAAALIVAAFWLPGLRPLPQPRLAPKPVSAPIPVNAPKPTAAPKSVVPSPAPPVAPGSAVPPPAVTPPAPSAKQMPPSRPGPTAGIKAAVPRVPPTAPPATPFDLPTHAPPVARGGNGLSVPQAAPAPPGAVATRTARPPAAASPPPVPPPVIVSPPQSPAAQKPVLPAPSPAPAAATVQGPAAPSPDAIAPAVTAGAAGVAAVVVPKAVKGGLSGAAPRRAKTRPNAMRFAAPAPNVPGDLDSWQAALSAAVHPPLWGENEGDTRANEALMAARESGMLDDLRARLEARRGQSPRDVVTGRMLAAVYDFGFSPEPALRERRRISGLEGADGEDWYALARAEERAGNGTAARAAYRRSLESPAPPSPFHAAIARGKG